MALHQVHVATYMPASLICVNTTSFLQLRSIIQCALANTLLSLYFPPCLVYTNPYFVILRLLRRHSLVPLALSSLLHFVYSLFSLAVLSRSLFAMLNTTARRLFSTAKPSGIKTIGVIGAGQMGNGIALVAAHTYGAKVIVIDAKQEALSHAADFRAKLLAKDVAKGRTTDEAAAASLARVESCTDMGALAAADYVIEAATENPEVKFSIFRSLDKIVPSNVILASNTSSIPITKIAAATERPEKVIGMHFMNPVPVMKLVEVITGLRTSPETLETTLSLAAEMGKVTTESKDYPGFIANRILMPYINEAAFVLQDGIATREHIDTTMKLGTNVPMGPLTLADFIGLDTCLYIMEVLYKGTGDSKYRPCPLLQQYVDAGLLGKKTGRGFYQY